MQSWDFAGAKITERKFCRQYLGRQLRAIGFLILVVVLVAAGSSAAKSRFRQRTSEAQSVLLQERRRCAMARADIVAAENAKLQIEWQRGLGDVTGRSLGLLSQICSAAPEGVWLNRVQSSDGKPVISVEGLAQSYGSLSLFLGRLRASTGVTEVRLTDARTANEETKQISFSAEMQVASVEASEAPKAAAVPAHP